MRDHKEILCWQNADSCAAQVTFQERQKSGYSHQRATSFLEKQFPL